MKLIENIVRGEIYMADLDPCIGSEQGGIRPVVIIQNNTGNRFSTTTIVASPILADSMRVSAFL